MLVFAKIVAVLGTLVVGTYFGAQHDRIDVPIHPEALKHIDKCDFSQYMTPEQEKIFKETIKQINERGND